jgi:hypothetical protein
VRLLHPRTFSTDYIEVRDKLTSIDQMRVGVIEDQIAESPDLRLKGRFEDHGYWYETKLKGFVIEYRVLDGRVHFDRLLDLRNHA